MQALIAFNSILPLRQGIPEQQTHDYIRHGTTSRFAAMEIATGKISARGCYPRHTLAEFIDVLDKGGRRPSGWRTARELRQLRYDVRLASPTIETTPPSASKVNAALQVRLSWVRRHCGVQPTGPADDTGGALSQHKADRQTKLANTGDVGSAHKD